MFIRSFWKCKISVTIWIDRNSPDVSDQCSSISPNKPTNADLKKIFYCSSGSVLNTDPRTCLVILPHILITRLKCQRRVGYVYFTFEMVWSEHNVIWFLRLSFTVLLSTLFKLWVILYFTYRKGISICSLLIFLWVIKINALNKI